MNRLWFGLSIVPLFSLVSCVQVETISCGSGRCDVPPPPMISDDNPDPASPETSVGQAKVIPSSHPPATVITGEQGIAPLCLLNPPLPGVQKQHTSAWCWAASTTLVINHLEPDRAHKQCSVVQATLTPEIEEYIRQEEAKGRIDVRVDCCLVTDEEMKNYDPQNNPKPSDKYVNDSIAMCHTTGRPEWALWEHGYGNRFKVIRWDPSFPEGQGLTWESVTGQICDNRPFISVKAWSEGGTHTEVITGYRYNGPEPYVDVDTHGLDTFFGEPFHEYQGKPGDYVHVRDYYDIGL